MSDLKIRSSKIDAQIYERWIHRILSHWHLFLITFGIAYFSAYLYLKYSTNIFSVAGTVIVKDASQNINPFENRGGTDNSFTRSYNLLNDIKIFTSKRLVTETVKNTDWRYTTFVEGKVKTSELFKDFPFTITENDSLDKLAGINFNIKTISDKQFEIYSNNENLKYKSIQNFNEVFFINNVSLKIVPKYIPQNDDVYVFTINRFSEMVNYWSSKLKVYQIDKNSSVLSIGSQGANVEKEMDFVNKHCQTFIKTNLEDKNATNERTIKFIEAQLGNISDTLFELESEITSYRKRFNGSNMEVLIEKRFAKLELLEEEKAKFMLSNRYFDYLKKYLESKSDYADIVAPASVGVQDAVLSKLLEELMQLKLKQNTTFKAEQNLSPFRIDNENKINQLKKNISEVIKNIENSNKILIEDVGNRIAKIEGTAKNIIDNEREYIELKRKYKINEELYNILLKRKSELAITRAGMVGDSKVVDYAFVNGKVSPNNNKIYTSFFLIAFLLPMLFIILKYITKFKVLDKQDVLNECNIPFLGAIGHLPDKDNLVIINRPSSSLAECFRSIRANLSFFMTDTQKKVILITSSVSGDGKTFTSLNIASIIAMSGKKIVLIGADMRKPKIYLDIEIKNALGLSNYLSHNTELPQIINQTKFENLYFISSGPIPPNPSELLLSNRMEELIKELKSQFDYILFDTPPMGIVSDAISMMKFSDVNIYVVRHNYTQLSYIKELSEYINSGNIKNMTFVMNDFSEYKNYGYGYRYGSKYGYYAKSKNANGYYSDESELPKSMNFINYFKKIFIKN